jgi:type VI secretion system protein ImpC
MSEPKSDTATETATPAAEAEGASLLDEAIGATRQTEPDRARELLRNLTEEALEGQVTFDKNLLVTLNRAIAAIDAKMSEQLNAIMHHEKFSQLEGTWRGLRHLVFESETSENLKIRVLNASKKDLHKDLTRAAEFDQSAIFKKIYENEFGMPGGEPYGALVGDYEFSHKPQDLEVLREMSHVAAASFAPFIANASPQLFGFEDFRELSKPRDLAKTFEGAEHAKWRQFRESDDARFVVLTMPRVLARLPYGRETSPVESFDYEEAPLGEDGRPRPMAHEDYCWMGASYVLGTKLTEAFALYGWCTAIRGAEGGGRVDNLPLHTFVSDDGDVDAKCPTEIGVTDRREAELSKLGFLSLGHYKNTDYAVFFGAQTTQKPPKYDKPAASENAAISARLPYIMASSRFAHYLKVMGRDKVGSFMEAQDCQRWLNDWIQNYVNSNESASQETKAMYPLREAQVTVSEVPGAPGAYNAVAHLRPWLQMEELTASMRMVARIPQSGG